MMYVYIKKNFTLWQTTAQTNNPKVESGFHFADLILHSLYLVTTVGPCPVISALYFNTHPLNFIHPSFLGLGQSAHFQPRRISIKDKKEEGRCEQPRSNPISQLFFPVRSIAAGENSRFYLFFSFKKMGEMKGGEEIRSQFFLKKNWTAVLQFIIARPWRKMFFGGVTACHIWCWICHSIRVVREESRHREKKGGSQVTARARERERRRYSM